MDRSKRHTSFWRTFLSHAEHRHQRADCHSYDPAVLRIGDSVESADEGAALILSGVKTATSSLRASYSTDRSEVPRAGDLSILEDGAGRPLAVVETTEVTVERFADIDDAFARAYGEWGGSLKTWRRECRAHYGPILRAQGRVFGEDTELVCERLRLLFRADDVSVATAGREA